MSGKILPFKKSPVIGFLGHAYVLGVLTNYEECMPWFYSNYIQLYISNVYINLDQYRLDFFPDILMIFSGVPWLEYQSADKRALRNNNTDINKFVMDHIDRGFYFFAYVDDFYVPDMGTYQSRHITHDIMIYGYNPEEETFNFAGFDKEQKFQFSKISFNEFDMAFNQPVEQDKQNYVNLFRKIDNSDKCKCDLRSAKCDFDLRFVIDMLSDYLYSSNSYKKLRVLNSEEESCGHKSQESLPQLFQAEFFQDEGIYGIAIYEYLIKYIDLLIDGKVGQDVRPFHILWEHKKCMVMRIKYLQYNGYMDISSPSHDACVTLQTKAEILRNAFIRYTLTEKTEALEKMKAYLREISEMEQVILKNMIDELRLAL